MNFKGIDVETANTDYSSIYQIGLITVEEGVISGEWNTLINPEAYFALFNISNHGIDIDEEAVKSAPTFDDIYNELAGIQDESKLNGYKKAQNIGKLRV